MGLLDLLQSKNKKKSNEEQLQAGLEGFVVPINEVEDETFAEELLGPSVAIEPQKGELRSPFSGTIANVFDTKHALSLITPNGIQLLIHIGIDTVQMNGDGFQMMVKKDQKVQAGELLAKFDIEYIKEKGFATTVFLIVSNPDDFSVIEKKNVDKVNHDDVVMKIVK